MEEKNFLEAVIIRGICVKVGDLTFSNARASIEQEAGAGSPCPGMSNTAQ